MDRREALKTIGILTGAAALGAVPVYGNDTEDEARQHIHVNVPSYDVNLYSTDGDLVESYDCRVGMPGFETPIREGFVSQKREEIGFYDSNGNLITESTLEPIDKTIKMPYDRMRALWTKWYFPSTDRHIKTGEIFHATTEYWTIGTPASHGCIGLETDEMLDLYNRIEEPLPTVENTYQTVFIDQENDTARFWADIYDRESNTVDALLDKAGLSTEDMNTDRVEKNLEAIDSMLDAEYDRVKRVLAAGEEPTGEDEDLSLEVDLETVLTGSL